MIVETEYTLDEWNSTTTEQTTLDAFVGDILDEIPTPNTTRIYVQNLNGLCWDKNGGRWPYICEAMDAIQADISCFSELNIDTDNYTVRKTMEKICQHQFHQNNLVLSTSKKRSSTLYKPGGTAILARNEITARLKNHTRDRMGRWTTMSFTTSSTRKIRIISAYQVCNNSTPGTNTAASQQRAQIIEETALTAETNRQNPRQAFIHDLQGFIIQLQNSNEDIILVGDFNEDITAPGAGMDMLATECQLIDLFSIRLGSPFLPATYQRGSKRLDYILISPNLLPHVKAAGYDPFGYRIPSDHRGMYVDFHTEGLFQQPLSMLAPMTRRDFSTTSPGTVEKYVRAKMSYLHEHRFFERLEILENLIDPNHELAEALDRDFTRASEHAARVCAKRHQPPWSPKLAEVWAEIHFYRMAKSALSTTANYQPALRRIQEKWPNLPRSIPTNVAIIEGLRQESITKLKAIRKEAQALRDTFLEQQAMKYKDLKEKGKANIVHRIIRAESQKKVYQKINYLRQQGEGTFNLTQLKIPKEVPITNNEELKRLPDTPEHWETITIPNEIERLLLERNRYHFSQAHGTPFTTQPLQADIGFKADGMAVEMILNGNYRLPNISEATALLLQHLHKKTTEEITSCITKEDVLGKLKNWHESTTTSPSGLHLGHYHVVWREPRTIDDDEEKVDMQQQQDQLLRATVSFLNYAIKHRYSYHRWTKVVNVMLQKDPGNPRIHRLRVIHLYEADYNLLLAVKWRQAMYHAEKNNAIHDGLYGSRHGRSAHDPAFIEVLQNEIYRMSMKSGINFDLDATSCYDRIIPSVAALCSRRVGMPQDVTQINMTTLEQAKYHLKTNLGISKGSYGHHQENPIYGTGQGSGNSPTLWCFVCSALFDALDSAAHGATFTTYDKNCQIPMKMIGFVDDCTQRVNKFHLAQQPTSGELLSTMQRDVQVWNDLLWSSGGALEQLKCSFHLIQSQWTSDGHPFLKGGLEGRDIFINHNNQNIPTRQLSNYTAHKTLGCYINPAYNHKQAWTQTHNKNNMFADMILTNYFSRHEAWTYYTAFYLPSLTYPLQITPLTQAQCDRIDSRFLQTLLPRCGYNRHMSRAIRHAPFSLGGAGFKQLYVEQGTLMIQMVQKYLNSPGTTIGKLLLAAISWTQAFLGTSKLFLTAVHDPIPPSGPSFLLDVRAFLQKLKGSITLQQPPVSPILRKDDRHIMDIVMRQTQWNRRQIIQINSCRRYLQAQTLADITNIQGTRILTHCIQGTAPQLIHSVRVSTFNQQKPGHQAWKTWKKFLATICNRQAVLLQPLSNWIVDITQIRHWPQYIYDDTTDMLFSHYHGSSYYQHPRIRQHVFNIRPTETTATTTNGYPTSVSLIMDTLRPQRNYQKEEEPRSIYQVEIRGQVRHVTQWEHDLLHCNYDLHAASSFGAAVQQSKLLICSDGSVASKGGSFGYVVSTSCGRQVAKGRGPAPGAHPNSFRSEAYGVLAALRWLRHALHEVPEVANATITHYLDNKSVIRRVEQAITSSIDNPNKKLLPEHDVITESTHTLKELPLHIEFKWVKGHQNATTAYSNLDVPAKMNCDADSEASLFHWQDNTQHRNVAPLPHTPSQLAIDKQSITAHIKRRVREAVHIPQLHKYLQQKFEWDEATLESIDWQLYSAILTTYKDRWTMLVKHLHGISPTGHIAHQNDKHLPHQCPACSAPHENNLHVLLCEHPSRKEWRNETMHKINTYEPTESDPYLLDILRDGLTRFHRQLDPLNLHQYPNRYSHLIENQNKLGWDQLYRGRWTKEWSSLQSEYCETNNEQTSGTPQVTRWSVGLGRLLIDQWIKLWQLRNIQRHGADIENQNQIRQQVLHSELRELYTYRHRVCPTDLVLFHPSVDHHLNHHPSLDTIETWIATNKEAIKASAAQAQRLGIIRNRTLDEYPAFNPIPLENQQDSQMVELPDH